MMIVKWMSLFGLIFFIGFVEHVQAEQKQTKVIVFDFSGVIAKTDKQELIRFIAQSLHISENEAIQALKVLKQELAQGKKEQDFWTTLAASKGIKLPDQWIDKLNDARVLALKEVPGMVNLIKELQKQGYQTALLSNAGERPAAIRRRSRFYPLFQPALFSADIGSKKPDRKVYEILLNQLKVPPQAVLFIDNKQENIDAAKLLGIDGIVFSNIDQLILELEKRGIKILKLQSALST
jgi:putative hydrolase of the HAD superfamily